ncbi:hypothetical protein FOA52_008686 [Chlamydomonas sp. UWO 241]|nr:hypothetical protein FOA52_008686 [Chlamydomonas sp. UWO 241]
MSVAGGVGLEDEVVAWARKLGFRAPDACLARGGVAKLTRGDSRAFWEYTIRNFHAADEVQGLREATAAAAAAGSSGDTHGARGDDTARERDAACLSKRHAALPLIETTNATLAKMRDAHMKRYQEKMEESVKLEARSAQAATALEDARMQLAVLRAYRSRIEALLPQLASQHAAVSGVRAWARGRAQASASSSGSGGGGGVGVSGSGGGHGSSGVSVAVGDLPALCDRLTSQLRGALEARVRAAWGVCLEQVGGPGQTLPQAGVAWAADPASASDSSFLPASSDGLSSSSDGVSDSALLSAPLPPDLATALRSCLMAAPPQQLLSSLARITVDAATGLLHAGLVGPMGSSQQAPGISLQQAQQQQQQRPPADPLQLLAAFQGDHVARFVDAQVGHNAAAEHASQIQALAGQPAAEALLSRPVARMGVAAAGARARVACLTTELHALHAKHGGRTEAQATLQTSFEAIGAQRRLLDRLSALVMALSNEGGALIARWESEEERWGTAVHSQLPSVCASAAAACGRARGVVAGELSAWSAVPPGVLLPGGARYRPLLGGGGGEAGASSSSGGCDAQRARSLSLLPELPQLRATASGASQQQQQQQQPHASSSTSAAAAAAAAAYRAGVGGGVASAALLLRGAAELDVTAPLKCGGAVALLTADRAFHAAVLSAWLSDVASHSSHPHRHLEWHYVQYGGTRRRLDALRAEDESDRLPRAIAALASLHALRAHYDGSFRVIVADTRGLPAVGLLPDVKVDGCSAAEWLLATRDSHAMLRVTRDEVASAKAANAHAMADALMSRGG